MLGPRAKTEAVAPGVKPRKYWEGRNQHPTLRSAAETTGLAALAFARSRPEDPLLAPAIEWLSAHRVGTGLGPAQGEGAGGRGPGRLLRSGAGGRGQLHAGRDGQRPGGRPLRGAGAGRGEGDPRALEGGQGGGTEPGPLRPGRARDVRLRRDLDRLRPRLPAGSGPDRPAVRHQPPRLSRRRARVRGQALADRLQRRGQRPVVREPGQPGGAGRSGAGS